LEAGVELLRALTDGKVYLTLPGSGGGELDSLPGVEVHRFRGPHPAGLVGTHIHEIAPLKADQTAWYLKAGELALLGEWVLSGRYPTHRTVAVAGSRAPRRQYFRVRHGAALMTLTGGQPLGDDVRVIRGTVLNGDAVGGDGFLGFYTWTVTAIDEGADRRDMFGWALPQFGKLSASRAVFSWLMPKKAYDADARLNGGPRAVVNIGAWESVTPLDIHPTFLTRAIRAGDLDEALQLGLLEVTEEDVALCTFADPCKIEVGEIIREGLDLYEEEA
ncbi:MAG: NADH:ubiquinone reductase (Na(+)-transporting) subunit A, partial [Planctomycetes bacterium]|nr:NADH:ubiquinone reductase (Na(+)-transporting) subunit A [Planctomycetota bacterium]